MELVIKLMAKIVCYSIVIWHLGKMKISDIKWKYWEYKHKDFLNNINRSPNGLSSFEKFIDYKTEDNTIKEIKKELPFRIPDASYAMRNSAINQDRVMMEIGIQQRTAEAQSSLSYMRQEAQLELYAAYRRGYSQQRQNELQMQLGVQHSQENLGGLYQGNAFGGLLGMGGLFGNNYLR